MTALTLERPSAFVPPEPPPPVAFGPTWAEDPEWDGVDPTYRYLLPEFSLGWQIIGWVQDNLLGDDGKPFDLTFEQRRFLLWWYAIDEHGEFIYHQGVLQRLKGWGKDPLAAVICAVEFVGPCRFAGWATRDIPELGLHLGDPVAVENPRAWVQIAAVSKKQTKNTMLLFQGLFTDECKQRHGMTKHSIGQFQVYAHSGTRQIEAVTSSPKSLEGGRPTFQLLNETHHWVESNAGLDMFEVVDRNVTKSKGGAARTLSITNAYEPSENSVAQIQREAWEEEQAGIAFSTGLLYDSLEADEKAVLRLDLPEDMDPEEQERVTRSYLGAIIEGVRGDATWLNVKNIVSAMLRRSTKPSTARRFWFNQVRGAEDAWITAGAVEAARDPLAMSERRRHGESDPVRCGWIVRPAEAIVMFFDGSKSDDATALVGCRLSDGFTFVIGVWEKPKGLGRDAKWLSPRGEIDQRVREAFERFNIVAFWGDPSHAQDDDGSRYWTGLLDSWHREYKDRLTHWAVRAGDQQHAVSWDMASPARSEQFAAAAMAVVAELERKVDEDDPTSEWAPAFLHDGNPRLEAHMKNARRHPTVKGLVSLAKTGRESAKKIDLAVGLVGAQMLRRIVMNTVAEEKPKGKQPGEIW